MKDLGALLGLFAILLMFVPLGLTIVGVISVATSILALGVAFILAILGGLFSVLG